MPPGLLYRVYRLLLYVYPPAFRRQYGEEMARVFRDRCRALAQTRGAGGLGCFAMRSLADWLITGIREWAALITEAPQFSGAARSGAAGAPSFEFINTNGPRRSALAQGVVMSIGIFALLSYLPGHGVGHWTALVGSHHPSRSHLLPAKTEAAPVDLKTEVQAAPYPEESPANPYFCVFLVLGTLDADHDGVISAAEIANASASLRKLDINHDGKLTANDCGSHAGPAFTRNTRLLAALDADHDGEISASEIQNSPAALATLDQNGDGRLTMDEVFDDE